MKQPDLVKRLTSAERRLFLKRGLSLAALTMLTGCDVSDGDTVQSTLRFLNGWNERAQAALFSPGRLAPTFGEADWARDFRYNAFFPRDQVPRIAAAGYRLELAGLVGDKRPWTYGALTALPQESQITQHICIEGWSMVGKWSGPRLRTFLEHIDADLTAKYVGFVCADGYYESLDMPTALHPQTIMAFGYGDGLLGNAYGFPFKVRAPTKLGFKQPKWVTALFVTNRYPGGFWSDRGYNWFSGV
jgi:DMSO/TMAO reductase YedYZ molybdopterin-dependent catalytic subunit